MKILVISPTQKGIGGIAQHVQGLTNFLKLNGHDVEVISSENTLTIPVKGLKNPSFMISSFLKTKFKKGFDIVHAHNIPSALAMRNVSGKKVLSLHGIFSQQVDQLHGKTTSNISEKFEKDALTWADAITVISKEAFEHYTNLGFKVHQVSNAIDISSMPQQEDRKFKNQIIFAGRLSKEKGITTLLEVTKKLPAEINLIILGSGPEEKKVQEVIKSKKNIHFFGYQSKENTIQMIRGSDVLIQPSLVEGISSTIIEAMACQTPIIASDVGGNKELIEHDKTGILIDPNDSESLLKEILDLISNKEKCNKLVENGKKFVEKFDWNHVGKLYLNIYESLLNESKDEKDLLK